MKLIGTFVAVAMLAACGTTTIRTADGKDHVCQHYIEGIVWWDHADTDETTLACRRAAVDRMSIAPSDADE